MEQKQKFHWLAVLWSAVLITLLPLVIIFVVALGYGLVIGFQTRGDMEVIVEKQTALQTSLGFDLFVFLVVALIVLWRIRALSRRVVDGLTLNVIVAVVLGVVGRLVLLQALAPTATIILRPLVVVELLIYAGATFAGLWLSQKRPATVSPSA